MGKTTDFDFILIKNTTILDCKESITRPYFDI